MGRMKSTAKNLKLSSEVIPLIVPGFAMLDAFTWPWTTPLAYLFSSRALNRWKKLRKRSLFKRQTAIAVQSPTLIAPSNALSYQQSGKMDTKETIYA